MVLLYLWVTIRQDKAREERLMRREHARRKGSDEQEEEQLVRERFWQWESYSDYLLFVCFLAAVIGAFTIVFRDHAPYQMLLAYVSAGVEALLGAP
jgi:hypothetical protein